MQIEFSSLVQKHTDRHGGEISAQTLWELFGKHYAQTCTPIEYHEHHLYEAGQQQGIAITVTVDGTRKTLNGTGNGPIEAVINALQIPVNVVAFEERALSQGAHANAVAIIEMTTEHKKQGVFGVGIHANIVTASIISVIAALNRL
jgi:2-isopropylmalate synthase